MPVVHHRHGHVTFMAREQILARVSNWESKVKGQRSKVPIIIRVSHQKGHIRRFISEDQTSQVNIKRSKYQMVKSSKGSISKVLFKRFSLKVHLKQSFKIVFINGLSNSFHKTNFKIVFLKSIYHA